MLENRPNGGILKHLLNALKCRWMFAYNYAMEELVKRRHEMWSWHHIKAHRQIYNEYKNIYQKKLAGGYLSGADQSDLVVS
jgi:hypothetical protein